MVTGIRSRSLLVFCALALALALAGPFAQAGEHPGEPFSEARFRALQQEGALVLVDVSATWCSTCAKQASLIQRYREEHPDVPLHVLRVDFDTQKEWVRHFEAPRQSTLALYRGTERIWFAVAETREAVVFAVLDAAAKNAVKIGASG